jgi:hypothetical protein
MRRRQVWAKQQATALAPPLPPVPVAPIEPPPPKRKPGRPPKAK